jgi:hypothetical protein
LNAPSRHACPAFFDGRRIAEPLLILNAFLSSCRTGTSFFIDKKDAIPSAREVKVTLLPASGFFLSGAQP